jgi:GH25 family lysozyme M1 (1,4-beta-N-acetylmuramidase)
MNMKLGIDVSDNQGCIEWSKVKEQGVEFAILRSTRESGQADKQLAANIKGCIDNAIPMEFYKYSYALTGAAARKEAEEVVAVLQQHGIAPSKDIMIWADIEYSKQLALGKKAVYEIYNAFRESILNAGYGCGLYMGNSAYEHQFDGSKISDDLWIARYYAGDQSMPFGTVPNAAKKPAVATGSSSVLRGWQFTSHGKVAGINGNVDLNIRY